MSADFSAVTTPLSEGMGQPSPVSGTTQPLQDWMLPPGWQDWVETLTPMTPLQIKGLSPVAQVATLRLKTGETATLWQVDPADSLSLAKIANARQLSALSPLTGQAPPLEVSLPANLLWTDMWPPQALTASSQCRQGHCLTTRQLTLMGQQLAQFHQTEASAESFHPEPFDQWLTQRWSRWLNPTDGPLSQTDGSVSVPLRTLHQRFLSRHGEAITQMARHITGQLQAPMPDWVLSHGSLRPDQLRLTPQGDWVAAPAWGAKMLPPWWDLGQLLAGLPFLAHASYSAVYLEPLLVSAYCQHRDLKAPYALLSQAIQAAGLTLIDLLLSPDELTWITDIYLQEIFLNQAMGWIVRPSQVDWLAHVQY